MQCWVRPEAAMVAVLLYSQAVMRQHPAHLETWDRYETEVISSSNMSSMFISIFYNRFPGYLANRIDIFLFQVQN